MNHLSLFVYVNLLVIIMYICTCISYTFAFHMLQLRRYCRCEFRELPLDKLPPHIKRWKIYAFKPIIVAVSTVARLNRAVNNIFRRVRLGIEVTLKIMLNSDENENFLSIKC